MAVTLKDIADKVGKSVPTVSRALAGFEDISPKTRDYIQSVAKEMGYVPNKIARKLQSQKAEAIGLILPGLENLRFSDPFFSQLLSGIVEHTSRSGLDLAITAAGPEEELDVYLDHIRGRRVDGFIVVRTHRKDARIKLLKQHNFPFVAFGRMEENNDFHFVDEDGSLGIELMVDHLVELGHRQFGCIAEPTYYTKSFHRVSGFIRALEKHGLPFHDDQLAVMNFRQRSGRIGALQLLDLADPPTAIVACNDLLAIGAIQAAQEHGLTVGRDLSVTGFDNVLLAEMVNPSLTTLHQPAHEMGIKICEMLVQLIDGEQPDPAHHIYEPIPIYRASTGPASAG